VVAPPLKAQSGTSGRGDGAPLLASWVAVRRLTPRECERFQGFPDDHTLIPGYSIKLKPGRSSRWPSTWASRLSGAKLYGATPDGPRYKAIGNSMAVPVMRWIGERIGVVDQILRERAA
jgi:DNA (cytosine-5)-methyltransferase 1